MQLWGRDNDMIPLEWRKDSKTGESFPMGIGEHCVAGQVVDFDKNGDPIIEISDPLPLRTGSRYQTDFSSLASWMKNLGWVMAIKVG